MNRNTHQKKVILDTLLTFPISHPSADTVYQLVKEAIPSVSRATVYRILNRLSEQGVLQRIQIPGSPDRYDCRLDHHAHCLCGRCGKVLDMALPATENLVDKLPNSMDFRVTGYDIIFSGFCSACALENPNKGNLE